MFEKAVNKYKSFYNFDPLQLALIEQKDGQPAVHIQYYVSGEMNIYLPLNTTMITGLEESLLNAQNKKGPIKIKFIADKSYILNLPHYKENKSKYVRGKFGLLLLGFIPLYIHSCVAKHSSALAFLTDLNKELVDNGKNA